jgi:hypothetical protein
VQEQQRRSTCLDCVLTVSDQLPCVCCAATAAPAGQELNTDWSTVHGSGLRNRATLNAIESPEPNRFTKAPSEYRPTYERSNFTWMFSQAVRVSGSIPGVSLIRATCRTCLRSVRLGALPVALARLSVESSRQNPRLTH